MDPIFIYPLTALGVLAVAVGVWLWMRRRRKTPEQIERERRQRLHTIGRITDGTVIDAHEVETDHGNVQLLVYQYSVGGVDYEASQDVSLFRQTLDLQSFRVGHPASVKFDQQNPGNSIVIAEGWSGLR
jgi:multidrug resistance efflux pump